MVRKNGGARRNRTDDLYNVIAPGRPENLSDINNLFGRCRNFVPILCEIERYNAVERWHGLGTVRTGRWHIQGTLWGYPIHQPMLRRHHLAILKRT